jgi:hypothetical protein
MGANLLEIIGNILQISCIKMNLQNSLIYFMVLNHHVFFYI